MITQTFTQTLVVTSCGHTDCDQVFGMTRDFYDARINDHETWWCPRGHPRAYKGKSDLEQAQEQLEHEKKMRGWAETRATATRDQLETANRRAAAQKGQVTRIRNLIAKGICPVPGCRRNFDNVREHMATQHPEFHAHDEARP